MLHLAMKAFYPAKPPFPLLHVDTTWKFREMIQFRDETAKRLGLDLIVHINQDGVAQGIRPFTHGSALHTEIMKTEALKQALDKYGFDAAFGGARRDEEKSRAKERIFSFRAAGHRWDPQAAAAGAMAALQHPQSTRARASASFRLSNWTELDVWQYIHAKTSRSCRSTSRSSARWSSATACSSWSTTTACRSRPARCRRRRQVRFRTLGCYPLTGAIESDAETVADIIEEMLLDQHLRAPGPPDRPRRGRLDGEEEAGGIFLMALVSDIPAGSTGAAPGRAQAHRPAALHHLRQRRRRQEHPDRPPALRFEDDLRGPARGARSGLEEARHPGRRDRLRAAGRRARGRARAGHHHRRRLPLSSPPRSASSSSPTRPATSSTPATWSPAPRPPSWR